MENSIDVVLATTMNKTTSQEGCVVKRGDVVNGRHDYSMSLSKVAVNTLQIKITLD